MTTGSATGQRAGVGAWQLVSTTLSYPGSKVLLILAPGVSSRQGLAQPFGCARISRPLVASRSWRSRESGDVRKRGRGGRANLFARSLTDPAKPEPLVSPIFRQQARAAWLTDCCCLLEVPPPSTIYLNSVPRRLPCQTIPRASLRTDIVGRLEASRRKCAQKFCQSTRRS